MRCSSRFVALLALVSAAAVAAPTLAGAQAADTSAFCSARMQLTPSSSPDEVKTAFAALAANAGGAATEPAAALDAMYAKKGAKIFNSDKAFGLLAGIDQYVYEQCPGTAVAATAIDYEYQGIPASLPAGLAKIKFTNGAPKEDHEIAIVRLLPEGETVDPLKLFEMSDKKAAKYADLENAVFTYAPAGEVGYTVTE